MAQIEPRSGASVRGRAAGAILILVGVAAFAGRQLGWDPFEAIGRSSWPFFVIVPGLILLVASLIPTAPRGLGLAVAGSIVTTVGAVLLYQDTTGHWESWAYAWALVGPGAAGVGMLAYGLVFRQRDLVSAGLRTAAIAAAIFAIGAWYFEAVFSNGDTPIDFGLVWPLVLVAAGLFVLVSGLLGSGRPEARQAHAAHGRENAS